MSVKSIEQFYQEVMQEPALLEQFQAAPDQESLVNIAVEVGQQKGYSFTTSEVEQALVAQNAVSEAGELSDEQLEAVAGGKGDREKSVNINAASGSGDWNCGSP
ncbi:MAG TPA: Nif11-like leader peptide family natural product precursor [Cyanobacteria bacterium UBA8553]|nr:Nif11-like leader peptide family natural product precursor [Cyanobacteria bacterium UBA8553]